MKAMVLQKEGAPLEMRDVPQPKPEEKELLLKVLACGVCRTDLHIFQGDLKKPKLPLIMGHQIVGRVEKGSAKYKEGERVGVPWLGRSCQSCEFCTTGRENLCEKAQYTGYDLDGGYAEYCVAHEDFVFPIPGDYPDNDAAPLLCAGLIGYRCYRKCGTGKNIGFYGFGASAHILVQAAKYEGKKIFAFTRKGDRTGQEFAKKLGAVWAGDNDLLPPEPLDSAIVFAPVGDLVITALRALKRGGNVVCAGIHMSDIPSFPYDILWQERKIESVANLTRRDGEEFLALAPKVPIKTSVALYPLEKANEAIDDLKNSRFEGAAVLTF